MSEYGSFHKQRNDAIDNDDAPSHRRRRMPRCRSIEISNSNTERIAGIQGIDGIEDLRYRNHRSIESIEGSKQWGFDTKNIELSRYH